MILFKLIKYYIRQIAKNILWLYKLSHIKGLGSSTLSFPIICKGKGSIKLGNGCIIHKNSKLLISQNTSLSLGKGSTIKNGVTIHIKKEGSISSSEKLFIGDNTLIFSNNHWTFGSNVRIASNCSIFSRELGEDGELTISDNSYIGDFSIVDVTDNITIGNEVAIGPNCTLYTHDHEYNDIEKAAWKGGLIKGEIKIDDGAWIGSNVTILPNVSIGKRAVIAAGSVVTKSVPGNEIWGGVPAKKIKVI